jgi:hypothetical protein
MRGGYIIARENFKEAEKHVSAETDPVMFNLIYGLQSLTEQIASDFTALHDALAGLGPTAGKLAPQKQLARRNRPNAPRHRKHRNAAPPPRHGVRDRRDADRRRRSSFAGRMAPGSNLGREML